MSGALQGLRNAYLETDLEMAGHNFTQNGVALDLTLLANANLAAIGALTTGAGFPAALRSYIGAATSAQGAKADSAVQSVSVAAANGVSASSSGGTTPALTIALGAITPSSVNGLTFVAAATGFTVAGGTTSKTLTISNTLTLAGTDASTLNIGAGGTLGTAAFTAASAYATAAQGAKADNAAAINGLVKCNGSGTFSAVTDNSANWDTAYTDRNKWDGGITGLTAATGRTSLGGTTVGQAIFLLTNPSAISFVKIAADNSVSTRTPAQVLTDILGAPLASPTFTGTVVIPTPFTLGAVSVTATGTELNYVAGVTSAIQTQLNAKQASGNYALTASDLSQFAATTSAQLATVLSDESGTGGGFVRSAGGALTALTGLAIRSTGAAFDLTFASSEVFTAGRTLSFNMGDAARTLTFAGNATISGTNSGDQTITLTGNVTGSGTGSFATTIAAGVVTNAMLAGSIAYSKLSLTGAILNADLAGSIAAAKLTGTDIATVGTITAGTWNGSILTGAYLSSAVNAQTGTTYTVADSDRGKLVTLTNASPVAVTLAQAGASSTFISGWFGYFENRGAGLVTITPTTSTIDGAATITLIQNSAIRVFSDGTNYFTMRGKANLPAVTLSANNFATAIAADGTLSGAQPAIANLSDAGQLSTWAAVTPGTGVTTFLATPSSANLFSALTTKTGTTSNVVFSASPTLTGTAVIPNISGGSSQALTVTHSLASTGETFSVYRIQSANDAGVYTTFKGGAAGTTVLGYFGIGHHGTFADNLFTGELADSFSIRSTNALHLGTGGDHIALTLDTSQNATFLGTITGNGSGLTTLSASNLSSGTVAPARLGSGSGGATKFLREDSTWQTIGGGGDALVANPLSQFAATTSAQLAGVLSDESGTGGGFVRSAGGALTALTGLAIRSTGAAFDLTFATSEVFTAGRTLSIVLGDAARTLTLTGAASISGTNTGDQTTVSGNAGTATALATGRTLAITGDLAWTSPSFDGSGNVTAAGTLATVASAGTTGSSTAIPVITINAKGLTTTITTAAVVAPAGTLSGATLASGVTASSLTSFGSSPTLSTPVFTGLPTGTGVAAAGTASTLAARDANANLTANNWLGGYATTATAAGTTTLTVGSAYVQFFTGSTTQTVTLPVASTLTLGHQFVIVNNSSGNVTVNSSGSNAVLVLAGGTSATFTCILASGTGAASWNASYFGDAVASGKKGTFSNTLTLTGTDGSTLNVGTGGTLGTNAYTSTAYLTTAKSILSIAAGLDNTGAPIVGGYQISDTAGVQYSSPISTLAAGASMPETDVAFVMPYACTLKNLNVRTGSTTKSNAPTTVFMVRKNGADTALTLTLTQTVNTTSTDSTHTVSFAAGDRLTIAVTPTGAVTTSTGIMSITIECDSP